MTNKQIAWYGIFSTIVFGITLACGADTGSDGFVTFMYYASCVGLYVFIIWGWVRLIKSK